MDHLHLGPPRRVGRSSPRSSSGIAVLRVVGEHQELVLGEQVRDGAGIAHQLAGDDRVRQAGDLGEDAQHSHVGVDEERGGSPALRPERLPYPSLRRGRLLSVAVRLDVVHHPHHDLGHLVPEHVAVEHLVQHREQRRLHLTDRPLAELGDLLGLDVLRVLLVLDRRLEPSAFAEDADLPDLHAAIDLIVRQHPLVDVVSQLLREIVDIGSESLDVLTEEDAPVARRVLVAGCCPRTEAIGRDRRRRDGTVGIPRLHLPDVERRDLIGREGDRLGVQCGHITVCHVVSPL